MNGKIEIICGPMFSGKTEELLRRIKRLKYAKQNFVLFKPAIDIRYSDTEVLTHEKVGLTAIPVNNPQEILTYLNSSSEKFDVIAIDEGQFFNPTESITLLKVCQALKYKGYRVIINGLDMNFYGDPFANIPELMAVADDITKLTSVCCICGNEGTMTYKTSQSENQIELGSNDKYQAMCFNHWNENMNKFWRKK